MPVDVLALREARVSEQAEEIGKLTERIMVLENTLTDVLFCIAGSYLASFGDHRGYKVVITESQFDKWQGILGPGGR